MDPDQATPSPRAAREAESARVARQLRMLQELAEMGMDLVRRLHVQARTHPDPASLATSFARLANEVRKSVALEAEIAEAHRTRSAIHAERAAEARQELTRRYVERVRRAVRGAIEADCEPHQRAERFAQLDECLRSSKLRAELTRRPLAEIAATICRALRVPVDPSLFMQLAAPAPAPVPALPRQPAPEGASAPASFNEVSSLPPRTRTVHQPC